MLVSDCSSFLGETQTLPMPSELVLWCPVSLNVLESSWVLYNQAFRPCWGRAGVQRHFTIACVFTGGRLVRARVVWGSGRVNLLLYQAQHCGGLQAEPPAGH